MVRAITGRDMFGNKVFKERQEQSLSRAKCWFFLEFAELTKNLTPGQVFKLTNPILTTKIQSFFNQNYLCPKGLYFGD